MGREIERRFLLKDRSWTGMTRGEGNAIRQFYLAASPASSVRVRILDGARAVLTVKTGAGLARGEYEYDIPLADALELAEARIGNLVEKHRHHVPLGPRTVEVDVFTGALAPLVIAEIELTDEDEVVDLPPFLGREITGESAFSNARLALDGLPPLFRVPE